MNEEVDWDWVRSFVAVAESASMREAARRIGTSQPTLSRHLTRLEEALGVTLFDRQGRGLELSPKGTELYDSARQVKGEMDGFLRRAAGFSEAIQGGVRVTTSQVVGQWILPEWLAGFRERRPGITVELVLEEHAVDLRAREAELAVRMFRPTQLELTTSRRGTNRAVFAASRSYVAERGMVQSLEDLRNHDLIGFDRNPLYLETAAKMGVPLTADDFVLRTDSFPAQILAACAGVGIAVVSEAVIAREPELVCVAPGVHPNVQEVWLVAHRDVHRSPRVRATWEDLGAYLSQVYGAQRPNDEAAPA